MSGYRLPAGGRIDRSRPLSFTFDGVGHSGFAGDTLASALLANGVQLVGRSFKLHRPRGIFSCGVEEPSALVDVTPAAVADLRLETGTRVWLSAKATEIVSYPDPGRAPLVL